MIASPSSKGGATSILATWLSLNTRAALLPDPRTSQLKLWAIQ